MKKKIRKYRVSADESIGLAMSVVKNAAVESDFVYFSEQKLEKFVGVDGERRMIYGCALRPSFPIYRNNGKEEYYLEFDKEAIDKISKNYFKMGFQSSWTEGHKDEVEGLTITESWIKESMTMDKSVALGLDANLPLGSWFIGAYCENDEIWKRIKDGTYAGFSIEAIVGLEEFESQITNQNNNTNNTMTNEQEMNLFEKFKKWLTSTNEVDEPTEEVKLEEEPTPTEPTPTEPTVVEEPKVEEPKVVEEPTVVEEPKVEEPKAEEPKVVEEPKAEPTAQMEELINTLKAEIEALKESNNGLTEKIKEMGKMPSVQPLNTNAKNGGVGGDNYSQWREKMREMIG